MNKIKTAICFLTVRPSFEFYLFCKKLSRINKTVYICIDDDSWNIPNYDGKIPLIRVPSSDCEQAGFKDTVSYFPDKACSRDKALYYFAHQKHGKDIKYDQIWFLEEDVFIPTEATIDRIDKKYPTSDLLTKSHNIFEYRQHNYWNWNRVNRQIKVDPPYSISMVCAIRCSPRLLQYIRHYAEQFKRLFFCEVLFNTIALKAKLKVVCPPELSTIEYRHEWSRKDIQNINLYHPVKQITKHYELRQQNVQTEIEKVKKYTNDVIEEKTSVFDDIYKQIEHKSILTKQETYILFEIIENCYRCVDRGELNTSVSEETADTAVSEETATAVSEETATAVSEETATAVSEETATAEIGVYQGAVSKMICLAKKQNQTQISNHHCYDTFAGIPDADPRLDRHQNGEFKCSLEEVRRFINDGSVSYYKGRFPDTYQPSQTKFAFVYSDTGTYQGTIDTLCNIPQDLLLYGLLVIYEGNNPGVSKAIGDFLKSDDFIITRSEPFVIFCKKQ